MGNFVGSSKIGLVLVVISFFLGMPDVFMCVCVGGGVNSRSWAQAYVVNSLEKIEYPQPSGGCWRSALSYWIGTCQSEGSYFQSLLATGYVSSLKIWDIIHGCL